MSTIPTQDQVREALGRVIDPEIRQPITDLGMVESIDVSPEGVVTVSVLLTVAGCPLKDTITADTRKEVGALEGVTDVQVRMGVMNDEQRAALRSHLRGGEAEPEIPFSKPGNLTRVYAVTSGKGGVGKSSVTTNLAAAMAAQGLSVGVVDADIYGFSVPRMLGVDHVPTQLDGMIVPPVAHDVKVISIGMFVEDKQPVVWRGPMLHRAVQQFLSDVFWGDLDVLLLDLPPGTGDVTISVAQLLPKAEILVVTTPQTAAAEVAERTGLIATQTKQKVVGVIENMSYLPQPDGTRLEVFGSGGGQAVSDSLSQVLGYEVPLLAQLPLDIKLREGADVGVPATVSAGGRPAADAPAAIELAQVAQRLGHQERGLSGMKLGISPVSR
ncbi:MAG: P-loop NTPase [Actinomyces urogenitalis]|uniref:Iron-sulfur cluster carrier protein n=2 Tax=Actinomyces urogenitalis TaxID=103621 RepID=A0A2I1KT94_9ACTO|nr:P-loop NTPase [Actinomyces urogenitalis]ETJ04205.1 MAG: ATP-binding protein [Actinomyces urogenitalis DORA_12]KGE99723.1 sodium:proton antiporter [Actinomyces urogenitalis S6-C4]MBS5976649.1 Mrp/NBP35 family ATP-binding protein [Actinomyces urogenitalis]MBS6071118.1 Mrp/NBP35 family ATP-binding protein [Actinomyces urogenitalis]MDK8237794.1 P-loop NTPase [Actinomyces urogenitalis]